MVKYNEMAMQTLADLPTNMPVARVEFDYDYMSRRVGKTVYEWGSNGWQEVSSAVFLYDAWNLIAEQKYKQTSAETNFFTFGLDLSGTLQGAGGIGGLVSAVLGTNAVCYTYDANGNVSELINCAGGANLSHYEYSPFGETIVATGELAKDNPFRFSTKYTDDETSLVYYGYRYYLPSTVKWLSRDPVTDESFTQSEGNKLLVERSYATTQYADSFRVFASPRWQGRVPAKVEAELVFKAMRLLDSQNCYRFVANDPLSKYDLYGLAIGDGKYWGQYCGNDWCGGGDRDERDYPPTSTTPIAADDTMDQCCKEHDACLGGWDPATGAPRTPRDHDVCDPAMCTCLNNVDPCDLLDSADAAGGVNVELKLRIIRNAFCRIGPF
jgi:RHS repeat-associated protein